MMSRYASIILVCAGIFFVWGAATIKYQVFPYVFFYNAYQGYNHIKTLLGLRPIWYLKPYKGQDLVTVHDAEKVAPGLTLVTSLSEKGHPHAKVIDRDGNTIHYWSIDWFKLWPDETHIPEDYKYLAPPGPHIHGVQMMDNGDLVFNMERAGLFRLSPCGETVWKLPRMTHHSLFVDEDKNIWVPGLDWGQEVDPDLYRYTPDFKDFKILKVSPDGELQKEWRLYDILRDNGLTSLIYMSSQNNSSPITSGDTLHLNDLEVYPRSMPQGFFKAGDIMMSLRNINAVLVFDPEMKFKTIFMGPFVRQHDPDFIGPDRIAIFDNFNHTMRTKEERSRIIEMSVNSLDEDVIFEGTEKQPFFTSIMGKHQKLSNGNYLVTESTKGRALEVQGDKVVWEYYNIIGEHIGLMDEAQRLPPHFTKSFFEEKQASCQK